MKVCRKVRFWQKMKVELVVSTWQNLKSEFSLKKKKKKKKACNESQLSVRPEERGHHLLEKNKTMAAVSNPSLYSPLTFMWKVEVFLNELSSVLFSKEQVHLLVT